MHSMIVASCINLCSLSFLPDCALISSNHSHSGSHSKCIYFYYHFLVIWWLNLILCALSLILSFDYHHAVVRSLIVFILTIWEFSMIQPNLADDHLMYLFVFFLRPIIFGLFILDMILDYNLRICLDVAYRQFVNGFIESFNNFLEGCLDVVENMPWVWNIIDDVSKLVLCSNF